MLEATQRAAPVTPPEPAKQVTPWRSGTIESEAFGCRYKLAVFKSGVDRETYELEPSDPPRGLREISRRDVTVHGLPATLVEFENHIRWITVPAKPSLIARAVDAVSEILNA